MKKLKMSCFNNVKQANGRRKGKEGLYFLLKTKAINFNPFTNAWSIVLKGFS